MTTLSGSVLLYNASFEPMGRVSFQHAVRMLVREVAVVHEAHGERMIGPYQWPRALRLVRYVATKWLYRPAGYTRRAVLARDRHRCGYCGGHADTVDHLFPRSRGGGWTWLNTVAACGPCNERKGNRTPEEAGMRLRVVPFHPTRAQVAAWS
ncbi:MAG: HNH endonuclease [Nocardioides sp.]|nr:HNH endonuclease [Nocardioides sp.]